MFINVQKGTVESQFLVVHGTREMTSTNRNFKRWIGQYLHHNGCLHNEGDIVASELKALEHIWS